MLIKGGPGQNHGCWCLLSFITLQWHHNEHDGVPNPQPFIQMQIKKTIKVSTSPAFARRIHQWPVNSLHKGPVTRKMFPFEDVIMVTLSAETCFFYKEIGQNHGCPLSVSVRRQDISSRGIDFAICMSPCQPWRRYVITHAIILSRNDWKKWL